MIRAFWFAVKTGLLVAVAVWVANRPGVLHLEWMGYEIDAHAGVAFLVLFVTLLAVLLVCRLVWGLWSLAQRWRHFQAERRRRKGYRALALGLTAVAAGDAKLAHYQAYRTRLFLPEDKGLSVLLEGQAARLKGDEAGAREAFSALFENKDTVFLGPRGLIAGALAQEDGQQAVRIARQALKAYPRHPWVLRMTYDLALRCGQWAEAQKILTRLSRIGALDPARIRRDRAALYLQQADGVQKTRAVEALLSQAHKADPSFVPAASRLAQFYLDHKSRARAAAVLERTWPHNPHPDLVPLWRDAAPKKALKDGALRLRWFEKLVSLKPESETGQMAAATEALEQGLWGLAGQYLDRAEEIQSSARLYRLRARLAQARQRPEETALMLKKAADAAPDKVWVCCETGRIYEGWSPVAQPHGSFNTIIWEHPQAVKLRPPMLNRNDLIIDAALTA